jgi:polyisoprenoid-binding protein YceI
VARAIVGSTGSAPVRYRWSVARYRIDPGRSRVWIDARSNVHPIHSSTDGLEGHVELGPDRDRSAGAAGRLSLPVTRLSSGNRLEDRELYRRVEARRFPTIDGVLVAMRPSGGDRFRVSGDVTFRGVTRRYEDEMTVRRLDERTVALEGASSFDIRDFGMQPPRILLLRVEPEVTVRVEIVAVEEAGAGSGAAHGKE